MYSLMNGDQSLTLCGQRRHSKTKTYRPRHLHQSTLTLGDTAPCYTTTHTQVSPHHIYTSVNRRMAQRASVTSPVCPLCQSYSGLSADGRPLIFHLRDPGFPSQHHNCLDLSNVTALQCPQLSHTKDVHRPQHITPVNCRHNH